LILPRGFQHGDLLKMGILRPTRVSRTAQQHGASVSRLMITAEVMVAALPRKAAPAGGGSVDGMV